MYSVWDCLLACPADNRRRYNLNLLEYMRFKKQQTATVISVPPFVGVPEPEAEPRLKTPEKILVGILLELILQCHGCTHIYRFTGSGTF